MVMVSAIYPLFSTAPKEKDLILNIQPIRTKRNTGLGNFIWGWTLLR